MEPRHSSRKIDELVKHNEWRKAFDTAAKITDAGGVVVVLGNRGNGKTQLATELIRRACRKCPLDYEQAQWHQKPPAFGMYVRAREIGMKLREAYDNTRTLTEAGAIDHFVKPHLLVIDECQERPDKDFEIRSLTLILDKRYGGMKPTVMIANCSEREFRDLMGASIVDRIKEGGGFIPFSWASFRRPT